MKRILPAVFVSLAFLAALPRAMAKDDKWVEAKSANFTVVTNASPQQARTTAIQFEQIRELFQRSFAFTRNQATPVIVILAAKDENTLKELLPEYWAEKGHMHPAGIFLSYPYQPSVAVQLTGVGDNPYEAIYHEYYHSLTVPYFPRLPVWVSEGMAEFYGNSKIEGKVASMGMPEYGLVELLHQQSLIPLPTLFQVDHVSPYYNESNKTSIFYAESWALMHYLMLGDNGVHRQELSAYLGALGDGLSPLQAAAKAFGDLGKMQKAVQSYVGSASFYEFRSPAPDKIPESAVQVRAISEAEAEAYRGGFLSLHKQYKEGDTLLQEAVRLDPKLAIAQQNLGLSDYIQDKSADAITAFSAAIALDPNVSLTRFLRAELVARTGDSEQSEAQVQADLRAAIAANPNFAPAYGMLAAHLSSDGNQLPEALTMAKKGASLQPGDSAYQLTIAQVLARMRQYDQAKAVALIAQGNAIDPISRANADRFLEFLQRARDIEATYNQSTLTSLPKSSAAPETEAESESAKDDDDFHASEPNSDGSVIVDGAITDVQCKVQAMVVTLASDDGSIKLHSADYVEIDFVSDVKIKAEEFMPCTELKGHSVRVQYQPGMPTKLQPYQGEIKKMEIRK